MTRNLTEEELSYIESLLSNVRPTTASTHKIYLAYIEYRFPKPIQEVIDIRQNIYHDQILQCFYRLSGLHSRHENGFEAHP